MTSLFRGAFSAVVGNAYLLLILATLLWGGNAVAGRLASFEWQPFTLTSLRWLCAALVLTPFALKAVKRDWPVIRQNLVVLFALGGLGMASFNMLMYLALNYTTAINVSIEQASMPVMIMVANFVFLSQRVRWLQIAGLVLTTIGVLVTTTAADPEKFLAEGLNRGDLLMLLACFFYAAYTFGLRWRPAIDWMSFMWVIAVSAFIMSLPFAGWELSKVGFELPGWRGWLVLLYVIIFPTIVSQLCWARGVELVGSNRAGLFINLVPIFGSVLAVLVIGERFEWYHLLGLFLVLGGIGISERGAPRHTPR